MPAHDVTVTAVYETSIAEIMMIAQQGQVHIYTPQWREARQTAEGSEHRGDAGWNDKESGGEIKRNNSLLQVSIKT